MDAQQLQRLSNLLDQALELDEPERTVWLAELAAADPPVGEQLRALLARDGAGETGHWLQQGIGAALRPPPPSYAAGDSVGPYRLLRELGRGGMGEVWLAERREAMQGAPPRPVALKLPMLGLRRQVLVQRFARERDILAGLVHPHIARLLDAGFADDGQPYLAIDYVEGEAITTHCRLAALPVVARVQLFRQVLSAVQHAHANLVVHRDLKPSNVLVTAAGEVMLLDFGIAKLLLGPEQVANETELTALGGRAMTLEYASPEQIRGGPISIAADLWALGVLLYELVADRRPFEAPTRAALEQAVLDDDPLPPSSARARLQQRGGRPLSRSLAADLDTIVLKAMKKLPGERYATVAALDDDLVRWLDGAPVLAQRDSRWYRLHKFLARHRWPVAAATLSVGALAITAGVATWQAREARQQAERARLEAQRAEAVQTFLLDIFRSNRAGQRDPAKARQATARELLDAGAERLAHALKDAPESRLRVMATLAEMYGELGLPQKALELDRARLALARQVLPADDERIADVLISLVNRLHDGAQREEARAFLEEARRVLAAPRHRGAPLARRLASLSARFYRHESLTLAVRYADEAVVLAEAGTRAAASASAADRAALADALARAGAVRLSGLDLAGAEPLLQRARAMARERAAATPAVLIPGAADFADVQMTLGRFAAAEQTLRESLAASEHVNGPDHRQTLVLSTHLVYLMEQTGRRAEAQALRAHIEAAMARAGPALDEGWRRNAAYLMTRHLHEMGRPDLLLAQQRQQVAEVGRELPHSAAAVHRKRVLAETLISLGLLDEADALMAEAMASWDRYLGGSRAEPWRNVNLQLALARLRLAQGRAAEALDIVQQTPPGRVPEDAPINLWWARRNALLAEISLALGQPAQAASAARGVIEAAAAVPLPGLSARAWLLWGQAQLQQGDGAGGRAGVERAVALRRGHDAEGSVWLAQAERALAASALR